MIRTVKGRKVVREAYQRGFVSRKIDVETQPIIKGRKGDYVLAPSFNSTQFCVRLYLEEV